MSTMNISLPEPLKKFIDERVEHAGYGSSSEYLRALIRKDQDSVYMRSLLLDGASAPVTGDADAQYFTDLRNKINNHLKQQPAQ